MLFVSVVPDFILCVFARLVLSFVLFCVFTLCVVVCWFSVLFLCLCCLCLLGWCQLASCFCAPFAMWPAGGAVSLVLFCAVIRGVLLCFSCYNVVVVCFGFVLFCSVICFLVCCFSCSNVFFPRWLVISLDCFVFLCFVSLSAVCLCCS